MKKAIVMVLAAGVLSWAMASCDKKTSDDTKQEAMEAVVTETLTEKKDTAPKKTEARKEVVKKETTEKEEQPVVETPKVEEEPKEIGASPDAVYLLDDSETESAPKCALKDKDIKKQLKKTLRKAQKGEKAHFKASIVIKADGTVGRVQFTECGYNDDYKPEIIAALKELSFTPGTKDGKAVDAWYYLSYKR